MVAGVFGIVEETSFVGEGDEDRMTTVLMFYHSLIHVGYVLYVTDATITHNALRCLDLCADQSAAAHWLM